jgi:hypothetical protein
MKPTFGSCRCSDPLSSFKKIFPHILCLLLLSAPAAAAAAPPIIRCHEDSF